MEIGVGLVRSFSFSVQGKRQKINQNYTHYNNNKIIFRFFHNNFSNFTQNERKNNFFTTKTTFLTNNFPKYTTKHTKMFFTELAHYSLFKRNFHSTFPTNNVEEKLSKAMQEGMTFLNSNLYDNALQKFEEIIKINPKYDLKVHLLRIGSLMGLKKVKETEIAAKEALQNFPNEMRIFHLLAKLYLDNKNYVNALRVYEKMLEISPKDSLVLNMIGQCYFFLQRFDEAMKSYDQSLEINPKSMALANKADLLTQIGKPNEALPFYNRVIADRPVNVKVFYRRRAICLTHLQRHEDALKDIEEAIVLDRSDYSSLQFKASLLQFLERFDEILPLSDRMIKLMPNYYHGYYLKGWANTKLGNYKEGKEALVESKKSESKMEANIRENLYYHLGICYQCLQEFDLALAEFNKSGKTKDSSFADCYFQMGDYKKAEEYYKNALAKEKLSDEAKSTVEANLHICQSKLN